MQLIKSFKIDHTVLEPGFYISDQKDGVVTYDLRFCRPNAGGYLSVRTIHTVEHLFAAGIRSGVLGESVLYFGPMGCRTGFYLLIKDTGFESVLAEVKRVLDFITNFSGKIPGASEKECGNFRNHDLARAKQECLKYLEIITRAENCGNYPG